MVLNPIALLRRLLGPLMKEHRAVLKGIKEEISQVRELIGDRSHMSLQQGNELQKQTAHVAEEIQMLREDVDSLRATLQRIERRIEEESSTWEWAKARLAQMDERLAALESQLRNIRLRITAEPPETQSPSAKVPNQVKGHEVRTFPIATKTRRVPPPKRGGRPRAGQEASGASPHVAAVPKGGDVSYLPPTGEAEVLCLKRGLEWKLLLALPNEPAESPELEVWQAGSLLEREGDTGWLLRNIEDDVEVAWIEGGEKRTVLAFRGLSRGEGLLFKLNGALEAGRRVRSVSTGWYLAIVPEDWRRVGVPPIAPEPVALVGYAAHYFDLSEDHRVCFLVNGREQVPWQRIEFQLVGRQLQDAGKLFGPLFKDPPEVRADRSVWEEVATVVVGEEGPGRGRWKASCRPDPQREVQRLPSELAARRGGWYFLRFYNRAAELVDSLDFRFLSALEAIRVEPEGPIIIPGPAGYGPARVEFHHEAGCQVEPLGDLPVEICKELHRTIVELPPDPAFDRTRWRVTAGREIPSTQPVAVEVEVYVPRIWWTLAEGEDREREEDEGLKWQAEVLSLTRSDFKATSGKTLWLRLPPGMRRARFGFPGDLRPVVAQASSSQVPIPLREFTDAEPLQRPGTTSLFVQFDTLEEKCEVEIGRLEVRLGCWHCGFTVSEEEALLDHIFCTHREELYREPTYREMRELVPELPPRIYECPYCGEYVEGNDPRNPTSAITQHVEEVHHPRSHGERVRFRIVDNPEKIRSKMVKYRDLPRFQVCQLCGARFDLREVGEEELRRHVRERHWRLVSQLK